MALLALIFYPVQVCLALIYYPVEACFLLFCFSTALFALGALGFAGLFIPDSWLDDNMRAKMRKYLPEPAQSDTEKLPSEMETKDAGVPAGTGADVDAQTAEDAVKQATPTEVPANQAVIQGKDSEGKPVMLCKWCGGKPSEGCCDYGAMMAGNTSPVKEGNEGASLDKGGKDSAESPHKEDKDKPPIVRVFAKVSQAFKKMKHNRDEKAAEKRENVESAVNH